MSASPQKRYLDFCNSFVGDGGADVLFARLGGATKTTEELKTFFEERASIEEEYAKQLSKLAKLTLGRDEIAELRKPLDAVRTETERQAGIHLDLAQQLRSEIGISTTAFHARQIYHKNTYQARIEKQLKIKQIQQSYVNKAREKCEQDSIWINAFTAQASFVRGKNLEKINLKLERAKEAFQTNEREFLNFSTALHKIAMRWEQDWKSFCDSCQDMEQDRMDFMKDHLWDYANVISMGCIADDASCESIRVALEQLDTENKMENFAYK
ncbi:hypothetical protein M413DRAFT_78247 [Hebeloma cylindrosporum]|uniref:F-BAR domain-containing protein n=1 Tax=Hebeloma cylindrosporum TaxID=76867 RepID=A0A0C3BY84_HEBCY|nr:hypothetical protein M413DRAFT_78247 [Hebeloma cylindrosporum h7]